MGKSRLFVFQLKEVIYTFLFIILAIILIIVLFNMFRGDSNVDSTNISSNTVSSSSNMNMSSSSSSTDILSVNSSSDNTGNNLFNVSYIPGVYSTSLKLNNQNINLSVTVDKNHIKAVSATNLSDSIQVMYPLLEPSIEYIEAELANGTPIEQIKHDSTSVYTGTMLTEAITELLKEAEAK
ncbi:MAG: hypothetical protein E7262_00125 [Lachnospiraceae bacterium]|nr:hypothetical protein [Lachnospiraceae bacterium]